MRLTARALAALRALANRPPTLGRCPVCDQRVPIYARHSPPWAAASRVCEGRATTPEPTPESKD